MKKYTQFNATNLIYGTPWYDCAMVQFDDEKIKEGYISPCRIYGFFNYTTPGNSTPHLITEENKSPEEIRHDWLRDENIYVVILSSKDYLDWSQLKKSSFHLFLEM